MAVGQTLDNCQTYFSTAETQEVSKENSVTLSASVTVGVSFEDRTFTQSAIDIEATATIRSNTKRENAQLTRSRRSITFTTGSMEDAVVFTTLPYDRYTYTIVSDPHPELVGQTMTISIPREPITLMVERSFYNEHVAPGAIKIDDSVFKHAIGDRTTTEHEHP